MDAIEKLATKDPKAATLARALYNDNTLEELEIMKDSEPEFDIKYRWKVDKKQYTSAVNAAIDDLQADRDLLTHTGTVELDGVVKKAVESVVRGDSVKSALDNLLGESSYSDDLYNDVVRFMNKVGPDNRVENTKDGVVIHELTDYKPYTDTRLDLSRLAVYLEHAGYGYDYRNRGNTITVTSSRKVGKPRVSETVNKKQLKADVMATLAVYGEDMTGNYILEEVSGGIKIVSTGGFFDWDFIGEALEQAGFLYDVYPGAGYILVRAYTPGVNDILDTYGESKSASDLIDNILEDKWSGEVDTKWTPPKDFFTKSATAIASGLKRNSKDLKQAMSRLNFYINRAGDNLSAEDKGRLESAKNKLQKLYA